MDAHLVEWLNILLRWAHVIVGIGWIGTSFYFVALDMSLRKREGLAPGVMGSAWLVHGGGFYSVEKYASAPANMPPDLQWYKWEAYLTFLTGFALLAVMYYWNAQTYLIDPRVFAMTPTTAIALSLVSLTLGWFVYDAMCKSPLGKQPVLLATMVFAFLILMTWGFTHIFSGRGAFIHIGMLVGTIMVANVRFIIIPNQKKIVADLIAGRTPDPALGAAGKNRSMHNTFLTLPVILFMISNHYPILHSHPHAWLVAALVIVMGALARWFWVRHEAHDPISRIGWAVPAAAGVLAVAVVMTAPRIDPAMAGMRVADTRVLEIVQTHCAACHAAKPTLEGFTEAPKGIKLETLDLIRAHSSAVMSQAVTTQAMPLGGFTEMKDEERRELGAWLLAQRVR
jgi:uncharacterized membrane protein